MKISEVLICIALFILVSIATAECFIVFNRNYKNTVTKIIDVQKIITFDCMLRERVEKIEMPYWKNKERIYEKERLALLELNTEKDFAIVSVEKVINMEDELVGVVIVWKYKDDVFETKERL
ncbi:MAG: hypothetical protein GX220_08680 [Treponema sp.]|nr:hypothetical protein [Treponema sp.]